MKKSLVFLLLATLCAAVGARTRVGVAGISHGHAGLLLNQLSKADSPVEIVGIYETDTALVARLAARYGFSRDIVYASLDEMLDRVRPTAVLDYGSTKGHMATVEACAPRGIHVMVEKPLAIDMKDAKRMAELSRKHGVQVLTNYETTWYPTHYAMKNYIDEGKLGQLTKFIVYDGHPGPKGMSGEFVAWLTDPELNGGGAITDFGCYGANLVTWVLGGKRPASVFATVHRYDPQSYPRVDDDAMIILKYDDCDAVLLPSWSWPYNRKDMHVYGREGAIFVDNQRDMRFSARTDNGKFSAVTDLPPVPRSSFAYLDGVLSGRIKIEPMELSALENNVIVMEILDAARRSAATGRSVKLK
jgi:predicted dehydrogenase